MKEKEVLKSIVGGYFKHYQYIEAVRKIQVELSKTPYYSENWQGVKSLIENRLLQKGEPLELMNIDANLPLDDNTDEEAYKWFDLMIKNIEAADGEEIVPY